MSDVRTARAAAAAARPRGRPQAQAAIVAVLGERCPDDVVFG